ncbi:hypothetical protein GCM10029978_107340 [Actinoallomurus acanthiterrae]
MHSARSVIRRSAVLMATVAAVGFAGAVSAQAASAKSVAPNSLSCHTWYGDDNRGHGQCTGTGFWTLHVTCNPFGFPERTASTNTVNGTSELALGCGVVGVQNIWITF